MQCQCWCDQSWGAHKAKDQRFLIWFCCMWLFGCCAWAQRHELCKDGTMVPIHCTSGWHLCCILEPLSCSPLQPTPGPRCRASLSQLCYPYHSSPLPPPASSPPPPPCPGPRCRASHSVARSGCGRRCSRPCSQWHGRWRHTGTPGWQTERLHMVKRMGADVWGLD